MRIGITGAAGFIGKAIAARARAAGHEVVGLDLRDGDRELGGMGVAEIAGDINDTAAVRRLCEGVERVYHTAALVKEGGEWAAFVRANVVGADTVALVAKQCGVRELVHFSSVMVYGFDFEDGVTEEGPLDPADNPYCATKILAEECVMRHHARGGFEVYVIRPGDVYGPGSIPWTVRPVEMMRRRQWVDVEGDRAILNHVYIDNLLDGIDVALAAGASGAPLNITDGERTTVRAFFSHYRRMLGIGFIPEVPRGVALPVAGIAERALRALGRAAEVNREAVRYLLRPGAYGIGRIRALGFAPRVGLEEGMERCEAWLRAEGRL
ncbi:MAG TPA: NAD-dependent epimerase/dehydratase family protein [Candidatus Nanopelagicales bacterium]|nr:NAD-dependent epimerase/dehydratase family protein [Candidatus Nanopelagicales bacterium]